MWMTREEIARELGIVPNSVRGKVQKGQIERKVIDGKNLYRVARSDEFLGDREAPAAPEYVAPPPPPPPPPPPAPTFSAPEPVREPVAVPQAPPPPPRPEIRVRVHEPEPLPEPVQIKRSTPDRNAPFIPEQALLQLVADLKVGKKVESVDKGDEMDLATTETSIEMLTKINASRTKKLQAVQDALERLKRGEYGLCEECDEQIPEARLRHYPEARHCVRCQEELDQLEKLKDVQGVRGGVFRDEPAETAYKTFEE
jgi:DnaK suppressor protein